jgi:hypothetical protein
MLVAIDPLPRGALLTVRDVTVEEEHEDLSAERIATERAMGASRAARARINARGRIEAPDPALAALSGIDRHALSGARFAQLFDVASRMAVGDAIEQCFADGAPRTVPATLVVNRGGTIPVTLGFGAVHRARRVEALVALLYPRAEIPPA